MSATVSPLAPKHVPDLPAIAGVRLATAQAGIRYDFYNPDADSANTIAGAMKPTAFAYQTVAFAAAMRASSGRLIAEFDLNRNHNGHDASGNPANLPSNAFTLRGEISF